MNISAFTIFFWSPGSLWVSGGYVFPFRIKVHISITATKQAMTSPAAKTQNAPAKFSRVNSPWIFILIYLGWLSFLEKFHSKLEKFHSKLEMLHSRLEKFHSELEKFHSKLEKFHSKLRKFHSNFVKIIWPFSNP